MSKPHRMIAHCPAPRPPNPPPPPKQKPRQYHQNTPEKEKLNTDRRALFHMETIAGPKYFVGLSLGTFFLF